MPSRLTTGYFAFFGAAPSTSKRRSSAAGREATSTRPAPATTATGFALLERCRSSGPGLSPYATLSFAPRPILPSASEDGGVSRVFGVRSFGSGYRTPAKFASPREPLFFQALPRD